jgi:hypothetical protein
MRKPAILAALLGAAIVASLGATIPGAFAGSDRTQTASAKAWTSVIPAGRAVSGTWGAGCVATQAPAPAAAGVTTDSCSMTVSIFPAAPVNVEGQDMGVLAGLVENPQCAGDPDNPSAPPGVLCLYISEGDVSNVGKNGEGSWSVQPFPVLDGRNGFRVRWSPAAPGPSQIVGVWVYRAP